MIRSLLVSITLLTAGRAAIAADACHTGADQLFDQRALTTLAHVPGVVEVYNRRDFVAKTTGTILARREGGILRILRP